MDNSICKEGIHILLMKVNGENLKLNDLKEVSSLKDLLGHYHLRAEEVAVQINDVILERKNWENVILNENDRVELIRFVGGG